MGVVPHLCAPGTALAEPVALAAAATPAGVPPCHEPAEAEPAASHHAPAASAQGDPASSDRNDCCGGLAGAFCQHSCQTVGLVALSGLARPAILAAGLAAPGMDHPAAPPLAGPDHVPLA